MYYIDGESLKIEDVFNIAEYFEDTDLNKSAEERIKSNRKGLEEKLLSGERLYGVNTGFGKFFNIDIGKDDLMKLQNNLIRSHSAGVGEPLSVQHVRAMMIVRANSLSKGFSGIRPVIVRTILGALNKHLHPYVPRFGSVGASGDLAPLAHIALSLMGEGKFISQEENMSSRELLNSNGLNPLELREKEGVAFINGTSTISGILSYELFRAFRLLNAAVISAAISFTALRGNPLAFKEWVVATRQHPGQSMISDHFREMIDGSLYEPMNLQDAYSLRCIPQVYGAVLDTMHYAKGVVEREINSVTDNPIVGSDEVISAGNFHGEPVALVSDFLSIALTDLGNIIERRLARIVDPNLSGLPGFLTESEGLESGYMIPQYTAAALCNMNKVLSTPASADSIPTSANQEDHVSMGANSALKLSKIIDNLYDIVSIEFLLGTQGIDLSDAEPSPSIRRIYDFIRKHVPKLEEDRPPYVDIGTIRKSLMEGDLGELCDQLVNLLSLS